MKILIIDIQWNNGFNGGYTSMMELCRALPEGHSLKILGKYFKPDVPEGRGEALSHFNCLGATLDWITEGNWIPDIIWLNCLNELKLGDELSQMICPGRKIPLVANIRIMKNKLTDAELTRLTRLDQLICASEFGTKMWTDLYGFDVAVIPNSVNLRKFRPDFAARQKLRSTLRVSDINSRLLLYMGRLEECKGINDLPHILREAQAARPDLNYKLAVVGRKGKMPTSFKHQLIGVGDRIQVYSHCPNPEAWMQAADVMLMPSRWDELFGKVIVEAMACGLPVLATAKGGIPEILKDDLDRFLMWYPCHPRQWGQNIADLEDEFWAERLIAAAQEYDAALLAQRYIKLFQQVCDRKS